MEALELLRSREIEKLSKEAASVAYALLYPEFVYYHSERVLFWAVKIADDWKLEKSVVEVAAWLHDVGYAIDPDDHRRAGAEAVKRRLEEIGADEDVVSHVYDAIRNHGSKDAPRTPYGELMRFADGLGVIDPQLLGFYLPVVDEDEVKGFGKLVEKKLKVVEEYLGRVGKELREEIEERLKKTMEMLQPM